MSEAPARCPVCGRPAQPGYAPFCSRRCREVDLARWLGGVYRVPGEAVVTANDGDDEI